MIINNADVEKVRKVEGILDLRRFEWGKANGNMKIIGKLDPWIVFQPLILYIK